MENWKSSLEHALAKKLNDAAAELPSKELHVIDIGVFPWHQSIELSLLFVGDETEGEKCEPEDVAAWPNYDYSEINEGGWPEAQPVAEFLYRQWEQSKDIANILNDVASVVKSKKVREAISKFNKADTFKIQILNTDDPESPIYWN